MLKCDLNPRLLEEVQELFGSINQACREVRTGIVAQEEYATTINEINSLREGEYEYGEALCRQAINYLQLIQAAESAQEHINICREELRVKYGLPIMDLRWARSGNGEVSTCPEATGKC